MRLVQQTQAEGALTAPTCENILEPPWWSPCAAFLPSRVCCSRDRSCCDVSPPALRALLGCSDAKGGVPPVLQHFLTNIQALHDVVVLVHVRHVPVSSVLPEERLLIQPLTGFAG